MLLLLLIRPESYKYGTSVSQIGAPPSSWAAPDVTAADAATRLIDPTSEAGAHARRSAAHIEALELVNASRT